MKLYIPFLALFLAATATANDLLYPFDQQLGNTTPDASLDGTSDGIIGPWPGTAPQFIPPLNGQSGFYTFTLDSNLIRSSQPSAGNLSTNDFMISFWYKPVSTKNFGFIARKGTKMKESMWMIVDSSVGIHFQMHHTYMTRITIHNSQIGEYWQHIAFTRTNNTYTAWLDGARIQTQHARIISVNNSNHLEIGALPLGNSAQSASKASLDQLAININGISENSARSSWTGSRRLYGSGTRDADLDGLADWWELEHFDSLDADSTDDSDNDNFNNLQEFQTGMNPLKPAVRNTNDLLRLRVLTPIR